MIGRTVVVALVLVTAVLLQTAVFPYLTIAGFRPDLLLLVTVAFALRGGPQVGIRVGFAAGLLADLLLGLTAVGITSIVFLGIGYGVGLARPYLSDESFSAPLVLSLLTGVIGTGGAGVLAKLLGDERFTVQLVVQASALVGLYNTLLAPIAFGVVTRLTQRFPIRTFPALS